MDLGFKHFFNISYRYPNYVYYEDDHLDSEELEGDQSTVFHSGVSQVRVQ